MSEPEPKYDFYEGNQSAITEIFILGFQNLHNFHTVMFIVLLGIYVVTITGNLLIIALVSATRHLLHSPMYFFLSHLSTSDIVISTTVCPNLLCITWNEGAYISIAGCIWQLNMFSVSSVTECFLLTVMSYDRYLAICKPLRYASIMTWRCCIYLVMSCWSLGFVLTMIVTIMIYYLHFCGPNTIDHVFCDYAPLVQLSCSDTTILKMTVFFIATPETVLQPVFIIATYLSIILNILRISSSSGRQKAFSTCSSHLAVVCLYYGTLIATYATPTDGHLSTKNKFLSLIYTVGTPMMNPIIYTLKNKEIQAVIRKYVDQHLRKFSTTK